MSDSIFDPGEVIGSIVMKCVKCKRKTYHDRISLKDESYNHCCYCDSVSDVRCKKIKVGENANN